MFTMTVAFIKNSQEKQPPNACALLIVVLFCGVLFQLTCAWGILVTFLVINISTTASVPVNTASGPGPHSTTTR